MLCCERKSCFPFFFSRLIFCCCCSQSQRLFLIAPELSLISVFRVYSYSIRHCLLVHGIFILLCAHKAFNRIANTTHTYLPKKLTIFGLIYYDPVFLLLVFVFRLNEKCECEISAKTRDRQHTPTTNYIGDVCIK